MSNEREIRSSDIAVIGMNCRVPGAKSPEEFWENLKAGKESVVFFDDQELRAAGVPQETLDDPHYVKARATLDNIDLFDATFFGFSPRHALQRSSSRCMRTLVGRHHLLAARLSGESAAACGPGSLISARNWTFAFRHIRIIP